MTCETALELISQSLDEALSPADEAALQAHLRDCPTCRVLRTELLGLHEAWGELEVPTPPELKERILGALPPQRPPKAFYWKRWGAMAATVVLVALAAWRLPGFLYEGTKPQGTSVVTSGAEDAEAPALSSMSDESAVIDEALPDYVDGPGVNVNSYFAQASDTPAADSTLHDLASTIPSDAVDPDADVPMTKQAHVSDRSDPFEQESVKETDAAAGSALPVADYAIAGDSGVPVFPSVRMALAPEENAVCVDNSYDTVPESAPAMSAEEWTQAAEPLEPVTEELDPFGVYCGVLTLEAYDPQEPYPSLLTESGEVWYALPAADFTALVEKAEDLGISYELSLSGDNISADAPEGLVIVKPLYVP